MLTFIRIIARIRPRAQKLTTVNDRQVTSEEFSNFLNREPNLEPRFLQQKTDLKSLTQSRDQISLNNLCQLSDQRVEMVIAHMFHHPA